jgi:DNA repair ATPase RecN
MSDEMKTQDGNQSSPTVSLFQKAHAALVTLQRIDEQLLSLADRRRRVQTELRDAQTQLNEEMDRAAALPEELSTRHVPMAEAHAMPAMRRHTGPAIAEAA